MNLLIPSLPTDTEEQILNLLDAIDLLRLRRVSFKLKRFVDEVNAKWIQNVADLSFFHLQHKSFKAITDNATWFDIYCAVRNPANANLTEEFGSLPKQLNFFGETLTKFEDPRLQQASHEYMLLWPDYLRGCASPQGDNYFIGINLYKRPQNSQQPFNLNDEDEFQTQFEEFAREAVAERTYAFELMDDDLFASELCRKIPAEIISNPHKISVVDIFSTESNLRISGAMIYAGRSFMASTQLRNLVLNKRKQVQTNTNTKVQTCEEDKNSCVASSKKTEDKSMPYMVVDTLYRIQNGIANYDDSEDSNIDCGSVFKNEEFDATVLLPDNLNSLQKQDFLTNLHEAPPAGRCLNVKESIIKYSKLMYPEVSKNVEGLACLSNSKLLELGRLWHSAKLENISKAIKKTGLMKPFEGDCFYELALTDCDKLVDTYFGGVHSNDHQDACAVAVIAQDAVMIVAFHSDRC